MIRLIVNADDLGSNPPRDRGIFSAFTEGIVTSASLLANGPNFVEAAAQARACALPVGVHLNLAEGPALTGPIPGLTDAAGNFPGKTELRTLLQRSHLNAAGIREELLAQIDRVRSAGVEPDHLDTHQHCLLFPTLTEMIADIAIAAKIRSLRLPCPAESTDGKPEKTGGAGHTPLTEPGSLATELALYHQLAPAARQVLKGKPLWTPDGLWGMPLLNRLDIGTLAATLESLPAGTWELMVHPGYRAPGDPFGGPARETELEALTSPPIRKLIAELGIELTSFGACTCVC